MFGKPIITVNNLFKSYENVSVLENINFKIYEGEIVCIAGGSGCGKSTLLRQIIGLEEPTSGEIIIDDEYLFPNSEQKKSKIRQKFGVMFQLGGLIASMTLSENIELPLKSFTKLSINQIKEITKIKLTSVGLNNFEDYYPAEISGGMKKRAAISRAMALDPEILFLDEPSSGLDPISSTSLDKLIRELNSALHTTMVIITHDLSSIFAIADRVILLDKSVRGILEIGSPKELLLSKNKLVTNFFNRIRNEVNNEK
jgi:phospholipid/cholesterol/gamma-HCH transport system ATP-binding protein